MMEEILLVHLALTAFLFWFVGILWLIPDLIKRKNIMLFKKIFWFFFIIFVPPVGIIGYYHTYKVIDWKTKDTIGLNGGNK